MILTIKPSEFHKILLKLYFQILQNPFTEFLKYLKQNREGKIGLELELATQKRFNVKMLYSYKDVFLQLC